MSPRFTTATVVQSALQLRHKAARVVRKHSRASVAAAAVAAAGIGLFAASTGHGPASPAGHSASAAHTTVASHGSHANAAGSKSQQPQGHAPASKGAATATVAAAHHTNTATKAAPAAKQAPKAAPVAVKPAVAKAAPVAVKPAVAKAAPVAVKPAVAKAAPAPVQPAVATPAPAKPAKPAPAKHAAPKPAAPKPAPVHHAPAPKPYQIYDSVTVDSIPHGHQVATYANGAYAASASAVSDRGHVLWIDTNGSDTNASALDVEPGDATPAGAASWVQAKLDHNHKDVAIVYTMISQWQSVKDNIAALPEWMHSHVRYWIADPTGVEHVLPGANATQWYWGHDYDITTANPGFQS